MQYFGDYGGHFSLANDVTRLIFGQLLRAADLLVQRPDEEERLQDLSLRKHRYRSKNERTYRHHRWRMSKTLLLVFIHGFKGGDDTFGGFPEHLRALLSHALPKIEVIALQYPKFETRGDLKECVGRFREWLQNKVIDLEVAASTPSPTVDPSVHTILIGHSMGGIVAAETLLLLADDHSVPGPSASKTAGSTTSQSDVARTASETEKTPADLSADQGDPDTTSLLFPYIKGVLAFDTPFLGISPGVVAYGAEDQYKSVSSAYKTISGVSSALGWQGWGPSRTETTHKGKDKDNKPMAALPPAESQADTAAVPKWQSWGKYAMYAGAAGAIAAGGAAALYSQKDKINLGWTWVSDHLVFVGCLLRAEELKQRLKRVAKATKANSIGFANCYTILGKTASEAAESREEDSTESRRTFARLPPGKVEEGLVEIDGDGLRWRMAKNNKAKDEISAHVSMFYPRENPGYYNLGQTAKGLILQWIDGKWYDESKDSADGVSGGKMPRQSADDGWERPDWEDGVAEQKTSEKSTNIDNAEWEQGIDKEDDDLHMRDEVTPGNASEDLESSVLVDKAS